MQRIAVIMLILVGGVALMCWGCPAKKQVVKTTVTTDYSMTSTDVNPLVKKPTVQVFKIATPVAALLAETPEIVKQLEQAVKQGEALVEPTPIKASRVAPAGAPEQRESVVAPQKETIKTATAAKSASAKMEVAESPVFYVVKKGNCLWSISRKLYKTGFEWPLIYRENKDQIQDPDVIEIGQELVIIMHPASAQVADAVGYAQRYGEK